MLRGLGHPWLLEAGVATVLSIAMTVDVGERSCFDTHLVDELAFFPIRLSD